jgi:hypothetical protein
MQDQTQKARQYAKAASQLRTWRRADKTAMVEKTDSARRAEYHERQNLRQVADTLEKRAQGEGTPP